MKLHFLVSEMSHKSNRMQLFIGWSKVIAERQVGMDFRKHTAHFVKV